MGTPFRMLIGAQALARVASRIEDAGLVIDPVIFRDDGALEYRGAPVTLAEAAPTSAWFSPELFAMGQDAAFLALVTDCPSLCWMQSGRAGYDDPAFAILARNGVVLTMSKGPVLAIAEYVMANVLDRYQRGPERRAAQAEGRWQQYPFREISKSRWLCVGFGAIGREVARRARVFGAHVTGVRRSGGEDPDADAMTTPDTMGQALSAADVVVLSVPLSDETRDSFGSAFFSGFRQGALFVNVGRGLLVDEDALRTALDSGQVGHAVLDVTRVEPLPVGAWQWDHPGITLTAHTSGLGSGLMNRTDQILIDNMTRYAAGEPLLHRVDPTLLLPA